LSSQFELDGADVFEMRVPPNEVSEFVAVEPPRRIGRVIKKPGASKKDGGSQG
jgi:hypothetical protein